MAEWARRWKRVKAWWSGLTPSARISLGAVATGLLAAFAFLIVQNTEPTMGVLFSNLSQDDSARIVERLSTMGVPHRYDEDTATIVVPKGDVHETRLTLASEGLPSGSGVGFEVFDQQRFGESEFSEQVKYHRALEGELGRTISHLAGVRRARVHLVMPKRSLFVSKAQSASASVALHLKPGWKMREEQARGIIHLVASSVRGLEPSGVTLVDGEGRRLGGGDDSESDVASDALSFRREIEKAKEQAAQQILVTTLGPARSVVRVAAEVNFTREERTEETYDPQGVAARSFQIAEEATGAGGKTVGGVPGAVSNLPGGEGATGGRAGRDGVLKRSETRNFEVSKVLKHAVEPVGRVVRLQVAVVVDGKWTGEGEERSFEPMPQKEREQIKALVATAVGLDDERGDRITVESLPFAEPLGHGELSLLEKLLGPYADQLPTLLAILVGGILLMVFMRRRKKSALLDGDRPTPELMNVQVKEMGEGAAEGLRNKLAGMEEAGALPEGQEPAPALAPGASDAQQIPEPREESPAPSPDKMEEIRMLASELAGQEPEAAARVIRGWIAEDEP